jgi:hypothetical protein
MKQDHPFPLSFSIGNPWKFPQYGLPFRCSIPLAQGLVRDPAAELALLDEEGRDCAAQWRVLSSWPGGSVRFALLDYAEPETAPRTTRRYTLQFRGDRSGTGLPTPVPPPCPERPIRVVRTDADLTVDTGRLAWTFSLSRFALATAMTAHGRDWVRDQPSDLCVTDAKGLTYRASEGDYRLVLEQEGAHRVVVRLEGAHGRGEARFLDYTIRFHFTRGGSQVLMLHHVRNRHDGREGRAFRRCWMEGAMAAAAPTRRILHTMHGLMTSQHALAIDDRIDLDTDSVPRRVKADPFLYPKQETELAWQTPVTVLRDGDSLREPEETICESIYEKNPGKATGDRRVCAPLVDLHEAGAGGLLIKFAMASPEAEYPLHLGSERNRFEIDFFPPWRELHHLGEGMGKTRDVLFHVHDDSLEAMDLFHASAALAYPGVVSPGAAAYRAAAFADVHRTMPFLPNKYPVLEQKIDLFRSAPKGHQWPPALGWKHYGDEVGARGGLHQKNVWQFINNEEDYLYCCMIDAWRRGAAVDGVPMARHLMDIDYIDHSPDPRRHGATCPHSEAHTNGEVYTSHQWCQGLLYYYLATGDEEALRISKRIGDCLVWWITGPMKMALRGTGRETAWPLLSLSALYEVTGEARYRDAALRVTDDLIQVQTENGKVCWEYPMGSGILSDYMLAMTFNGIWDVWAATGEPRVLQLWKDITKPVVEALENPGNWGYVVFRNWQIKVADLTVLVRWYELTGDKRYITLGKNGLRVILSAAPQLDSMFQGFFAMWYRHMILYLKQADEFGLIDDDHCTLVW